jgi:60Kd inner membrane protein
VNENVAAGFSLLDSATDGLLGTLAHSKLAEDLFNLETRETVNQFLPGLRLDCSFLETWRNVSTETVQATCGSDTALISILPYALLIAVMGFTTYYQQRQLMAGRGAQDQQAQQMQMIMRFMPVLLMAFAIGIPIGPGFPAGVVLYWVTTNIWTIIQQRIILARLGPAPAVASAGKSSGKPKASGGKSGTAQGAKADGKAKGTPSKPSKPGGTKAQGGQSGNGAKPTTRSGSAKKKRRR